jgi:manganese transport protein
MAGATTVSPNLSLSDRTAQAGREVLTGRRRGWRGFVPFAGPAIIASIAYMDPGNFATNIQAGARYGYMLVWVVVAANLIAMLFQALSARVGIVTGRSLAQLSRRCFPLPVVIAMWLVSEVAAIATDLAELVGAAIGLSLLSGLPLLPSLLLAFGITWGLLSLQSRGFRPLELVIAAFVGVIGVSYLVELVIAPPDWHLLAYHAVVPHLTDADSVTLAVGIIGATVMPHAIYLHSALMPNRMLTTNDHQRRIVLSWSNREVMVALSIAGLVNIAMVAMAAAMFHDGHADVGEIETAYRTLLPLMGVIAAGAFMASLLASGISSSVVGTMAGQAIMQDFIGWRIPMWVRRTVTMVPALAVVAAGVNATEALVLSQVVLSLALPVPMIALLLLARRTDLMGRFAIGPRMQLVSAVATAVVIVLNVILLLQTLGVPLDVFPGS